MKSVHDVGWFLKDRYLGADLRWLGVFRWLLGSLLTSELVRTAIPEER